MRFVEFRRAKRIAVFFGELFKPREAAGSFIFGL
jgi:hypothetical protein